MNDPESVNPQAKIKTYPRSNYLSTAYL